MELDASGAVAQIEERRPTHHPARGDPTEPRPAQPPTIRREPVLVLGEANAGTAIAPVAAWMPRLLARRDAPEHALNDAIQVGHDRLRDVTVDAPGRGGGRRVPLRPRKLPIRADRLAALLIGIATFRQTLVDQRRQGSSARSGNRACDSLGYRR